ncbi:SDR family oxidoreductase [Streptacidiphilus pinicola]|uniref:SDR family oxidoreductase n=1 Tax=Streptacidiphilus pinicola TaxID=2219663 RepID=A0A2X0IW63_9ACTN|nr:SDR family oxidoreductase [Streptacidiphilus pinicola]RAG81916.1 SDR family oxidoreductase [Streptacidiphilus pinicola]
MTVRTALIAGAAGGICSELARALAVQGHRIALLDRDAAALERLAEELSATTEVRTLTADVRDAAAVEKQLASLTGGWAPAILVNGVGGDTRVVGLEDLDESFLTDSLELNVLPVLTTMRLCAPAMKRAGYGRIVNFSSAGGRTYSHFSNAAYVAAKSAVLGLTKQAAYELAPFGVCVNAVAHGPIATRRIADAWAVRPEQEQQAVLSRIPVGRLGTVPEAVGSVLHLCSEEAGFTTGAVIDVNGGLLI